MIEPTNLLQSSLLQINKVASTHVSLEPSYFKIPILLLECTKFLEDKLQTKGIFRVSGNGKRINKLLEKFEQSPQYGSAWYKNSHVVILPGIQYLMSLIV